MAEKTGIEREAAEAVLREKERLERVESERAEAVQMKARQHALSSVQPKPAIQVETKAAHAFVAIEEAVPDPNLGRVGLGQTAPRIAIRTVENQSLSLAISDELEEDELEE